MVKDIIWKPSIETMDQSNMMHFIKDINRQFQLTLSDYPSLYQWSIKNPEQFWEGIWTFYKIKASHSATKILNPGLKMSDAKWFIGAKLNFAENLMRRNDDKNALIYRGENGARRTVTYAQLHTEVAKLANSLRELGVKVNDRVAAVMPNIPETIIAMLATTSIGAIWSSCSPDFGAEAILDRLGQIEPKVLIAADGYFYNGKSYDALEKIKQLQTKIPSLKKTIVVPHIYKAPDITQLSNASFFHDFILNAKDTLNFEQLAFDHPVYIMYSSGTTGTPKCIVHGAGGTLLQHLKELVLHTDLKSDDSIFYYTTCGWMMWNWYVSSLATGATVIQYDGSPFYPKRSQIFDLIDEEKINVFGTSAKYISTCEKYDLTPMSTHKLNHLRTILSTGSPLVPKNFEYVYEKIKSNVCLSSISGGTDIISCFALGNPLLPVYPGELQCIGLGMSVEIFNEEGKSVIGEKGELVCTAPFPSMPIYFWNDPDRSKYHRAYFEKFPHVWAHGDYAEITKHNSVIIYGRSDALLNPGGIRIGTAEIYRQVEKVPEVIDSVAIDQKWQRDTRIILFIQLQDGITLDEELKKRIKQVIRENSSPHHVPAKIIQVPDIPRTINGKILELVVRDLIHNYPVKNQNIIANPESLEFFKNLPELNED